MRAEEALRQSRDQFSALIQNVESGVALIDAHGQFTVVNPMFLRLFGLEDAPDNILNVNSQDWSAWQVYDEDGVLCHVDAHPVRKAALTGRTVRNQLVGMRLPADGDLVWMLVSAEPIMNADGSVAQIICTYHDITEHKRAEEVLAFQARLLAEVHDAVFGSDGNYTITYWNHAAEKMFGWTKDEVLGKNFGELLKPQISGSSRDQERSKLRSAGYWEGEARYTRKDGTDFDADVNSTVLKDAHGNDIGTVTIARDITERKQVEEALRESEARFRTIAETLPGLVWLYDAAAGVNVFVNRSFCEFAGRAPDGLLGHAYEDVLHPCDVEALTPQFAAAVAAGQTFEAEYRFHRHDGQWRCHLVRTVPQKDTTGKVVQWFGMAVDITDRKQAEEALQASLREKEVLLKEIHHRVKNNMQVISSLVSLQSDTLDDPALRALFNDLRDRVRTMALVHEKLYQSESLADIDFAEYVRSLLNYLWRAYGAATKAVRLTLDVQPVSISIEKAVPCGLLLNELVTNALKHAFRDRADGELTVALHADANGTICLRVIDNGVGLPADWRQSPSLGLQLVQMLTSQVGGTLDVRSDGGTAFTLTFAHPISSPHGETLHA